LADEIDEALRSLPSAEAEHIHNDATLGVKVPNAQKVGRVLVMDTESHIGGGLFYPDDAVPHDAINKMNRDIIKDILKMMPTAYLLEALGVSTFEELTEQAESADRAFIPVPKNCAECWEKCLHVAVDCNAKGDCGWNGDKRREDCPIARPHGEWIVDTYNMELRCGICGEIFRFDDVDELLDYKEYAKYCLACGADMKGGDDE
jgi:hypothetical protein